MESIVQERLEKWNKIASNEAKKYVKDFCEWLGKSELEIISEYYSIKDIQLLDRWKRDYGDFIYKWYKVLLENYAHNSARRFAFIVARWLRSTCTSIIFEQKIPKATVSTKTEHKFETSQLKRMFTVGDVEERCILQLGVNLALRIEDFRMLPREPFERVVREVKEGKVTTPYELRIMTEKEKVVAFCQLTKNSIDTLDTYFKTKQTSRYLFSRDHRDKPITQRQLNYCLKNLWKRAFPNSAKEAKNIFWHLLRKYLITSMFNQKIDTTAIKLIVGKSVGVDLTTYLQQVNLSEEFVKVLPFVELGSFISVQPRTLEQQRQRELVLIETIKILKEKLEKLTGETITITIPVKQELPTPKELADLLNGNNNNSH